MMRAFMPLEIMTKSSSGEPHAVTFAFVDGRLSVRCNCEAGVFGKICKHKVALLSGDDSMLFTPDTKDRLDIVREWVKQTKFPETLNALREAEMAVEDAQAELKKQKAKLAMDMLRGVGL